MIVFVKQITVCLNECKVQNAKGRHLLKTVISILRQAVGNALERSALVCMTLRQEQAHALLLKIHIIALSL